MIGRAADAGPTPRSALVAASVWSANAALMGAAMALIASVPAERAPSGWSVIELAWFIPATLSFATVGALIEWQHPGHAIGRLMLFGGTVSSVQMASAAYAVRAVFGGPRLPAGEVAAWLFNTIAIGLGIAVVLIVFLFPDGRVRLRRGRIGVALTLILFPASVLLTGLRPGPLLLLPAIENPFPVGVVGRYESVLWTVLFVPGTVAFVLAISTLLERARRAEGVERQQLKWFLAGSILAVAVMLPSIPMILVSETVDAARFVNAAALLAIPATIGIAILRHRLYDIDVVIHRTLVYGAVSAVLIATYAASVILLQAVMRPFTAGSDLAVAGSTLLVVALFQPVRARMQDLVDRRFYRSRYDAARTLDAFAARLRNEVDLDSVREDLVGVVEVTMRPTHVAVWLRGGRR
jgi:hypothetical protein